MIPYETNVADLIEMYSHDRNIFWIIEDVGKGRGPHLEAIKNLQQMKQIPEKKVYYDFLRETFHDLDRALNAISTFEIAAMGGLWGKPRLTQVEIEIYNFLNNSYLKYYYETLSPKRLPQLFRLRLEANPGVPTFETSENTQQGLFSYIENDAWFSNEIGKIDFLHDPRLLTSYSSNLNDEEEFLKNIATYTNHQTECIEIEILRILEYFADFSDCLSLFSYNNLIQSAVWHRHESIFRDGIIETYLDLIMRKMSSWEFSTKEGFHFIFEDHLLQRHSAFLNLYNGSYEPPLKILMKRLRLIPERELADGSL